MIFLFLLLPRFGIGGYLFTYTLTHVINFYLSVRKLLQITDLRPDLRFLFRTAVSVIAVTAFLSLYMPDENHLPGLLIRGGLYLVLLAMLLTLTGTVDKPEENL